MITNHKKILHNMMDRYSSEERNSVNELEEPTSFVPTFHV